VSDRPGVLRVEESAFECVLQDLATQLPARPERLKIAAVVIRAKEAVLFAFLLRIRNGIRKRPLKKVVKSGAEHEKIEPFLDDPVDLAFPVVEIPMLGLKAVQTAVGEITQPAVLEARRLDHIEMIEVDGLPMRNPVTVPEPAAAAAPLEQIVDGVKQRARRTAVQYQQPPPPFAFRADRIIIGTEPQARRRYFSGKYQLRRLRIDRLAAGQDQVAAVVAFDGFQANPGHRFVQPLKFLFRQATGRDLPAFQNSIHDNALHA